MLFNARRTFHHRLLPLELLAAAAAMANGHVAAQTPTPLPAEVEALLERAKVPRDAVAAIVVDASPGGRVKATPLLS